MQNEAVIASSAPIAPVAQDAPHLRRVLGRMDLVLLFVVAVFNLNVVPSIAANGGVTVWLWIISLLLFFWPQGIAVIELAHRYPGEGGVYLWAKEVFGDFHGFLSGWCYWTNNMMYVPTVMLYFVGVSVFALGSGHEGLADDKKFALTASLVLLIVLRTMVRNESTTTIFGLAAVTCRMISPSTAFKSFSSNRSPRLIKRMAWPSLDSSKKVYCC